MRKVMTLRNDKKRKREIKDESRRVEHRKRVAKEAEFQVEKAKTKKREFFTEMGKKRRVEGSAPPGGFKNKARGGGRGKRGGDDLS